MNSQVFLFFPFPIPFIPSFHLGLVVALASLSGGGRGSVSPIYASFYNNKNITLL